VYEHDETAGGGKERYSKYKGGGNVANIRVMI
jgi:hypothetical protein